MGRYFVMSKRFDKCSASDFGLISLGPSSAIDPNDQEIWIQSALYDFGWGKENGFYKDPLPSGDVLFVLLHGADSDDMYGAAAIILEKTWRRAAASM